ncbi:MAG: hypothetical protein NT049_10205 [Planctomycetota bacterium]|nr:hypothetical protein [Planctomycetota bacterium]
MKSIAQKSLLMVNMFEAEVLTGLLLWRWNHPLRADAEFRNDLLENAAAALQRAIGGEILFDSVPAQETNLIAAIYFAEWSTVAEGAEDPDGERRRWLEDMRRALPSCFCAQEDLPPTE